MKQLPVNREIAKIIQGYSKIVDNYLTATDGFKESLFKGMNNGSTSIDLFGLYAVQRRYHVRGQNRANQLWAVQKIYAIGQPAQLLEKTYAVCSLRARGFGNPAFISLELDGKDFLVNVYTAQGVWASSVCKKMFNLFETNLPDAIVPMEEGVLLKGTSSKEELDKFKKQEKESHLKEKEEKKKEKQEIKEEKPKKEKIKAEPKENKQEEAPKVESFSYMDIIEEVNGSKESRDAAFNDLMKELNEELSRPSKVEIQPVAETTEDGTKKYKVQTKKILHSKNKK